MKPSLFLMVGLPGVGKTTEARRIEAEHHALRLSKDVWMKALFGDDNPEWASDVIEGHLIEIGLRALELGVNVIIDYGLWGRDERTALREAAAQLGAHVEMRYLHLPPSELRARLDRRQADEPHTTWPISDEDMATWSRTFAVPTPGELDGSEALDPPPAGVASWQEWRRVRWPAQRARR